MSAFEEHAVLEGVIAVRTVLHARSREIVSLLIRREVGERSVVQLEKRAEAAGIPVERVPAERIEALATGKTHGGVIAIVGPRRFSTLAELVEGESAPFVAMLDGIEDPFNFAYAVRSLYAAGATALVVRPRNWMSAAAVVARASAGASELMPTAVAETALEAADFYSSRGLTVACAARDRAVALYDADLSGPLFLVIGGERRGVSRALLARSDVTVEIPYGRDFRQSLGTTSAAAVLAFEVMRQRLERGS